MRVRPSPGSAVAGEAPGLPEDRGRRRAGGSPAAAAPQAEGRGRIAPEAPAMWGKGKGWSGEYMLLLSSRNLER